MRYFHVLIWIVGTSALSFSACTGGSGSADDKESNVPDSTVKLAKEVCSRCHAFIPPETLDKKTWKELVIPTMATKMGIYALDGVDFRSENTDPNVPKGIYPVKPTITPAELREIFQYFEMTAPDQLPLQERKVQIGKFTPRFRSSFPNLPPTEPAMTTFISILPSEHRIALGVAGKHNRLGYFDQKLEPLWVVAIPSAPAYIDFTNPTNWLVTCMGSVMPSNKKEGKLMEVPVPTNGPPGRPRELLSNLPRPVQISRVNLDDNGGPDILVNGFGHLWGKLYWLADGNKDKEHLLREIPGAIKSVFLDWDGDGDQDIITLFAQNKEGIVLFRNQGKGVYEEKELLGFLPVNGSTHFDVRDVNADGKKDIIYTCGDNADYSVILKNFHGVYIYLNQGNDAFKLKYFYPIHGCYKVVVRDFDMDGDQDMATIAFFADFITQWNEALVYFENTGDLNFTPYSIEGFDKGRWLTMDAGDLDGDGDEDIVTGNFAYGPESFLTPDQTQKFASQPVFMFLENTTK